MNKYKYCFIIFEMQKNIFNNKKIDKLFADKRTKTNINGLECGAIGKTHKKIGSRPC